MFLESHETHGFWGTMAAFGGHVSRAMSTHVFYEGDRASPVERCSRNRLALSVPREHLNFSVSILCLQRCPDRQMSRHASARCGEDVYRRTRDVKVLTCLWRTEYASCVFEPDDDRATGVRDPSAGNVEDRTAPTPSSSKYVKDRCGTLADRVDRDRPLDEDLTGVLDRSLRDGVEAGADPLTHAGFVCSHSCPPGHRSPLRAVPLVSPTPQRGRVQERWRTCGDGIETFFHEVSRDRNAALVRL